MPGLAPTWNLFFLFNLQPLELLRCGHRPVVGLGWRNMGWRNIQEEVSPTNLRRLANRSWVPQNSIDFVDRRIRINRVRVFVVVVIANDAINDAKAQFDDVDKLFSVFS